MNDEPLAIKGNENQGSGRADGERQEGASSCTMRLSFEYQFHGREGVDADCLIS